MAVSPENMFAADRNRLKIDLTVIIKRELLCKVSRTFVDFGAFIRRQKFISGITKHSRHINAKIRSNKITGLWLHPTK